MKYVILIGDGMADEPMDQLDGLTALQKANIPNMDYIARKGYAGLAKTVPDGMPPGSDVANMSIIGYDPQKYYSGRAPLEAASMRVPLEKTDVAFRCNLITIKDNLIADHSAGHITSEESKALIEAIDSHIASDTMKFYPGISYRHLLVMKNDVGARTICTPPHDVIGESRDDHLPEGEDSRILQELIDASVAILEEHPVNIEREKAGKSPANSIWLYPVNIEREKAGKSPANSIWLWGQGYAPAMPTFKELYGLSGSIISAVDLIKGIGNYAGLEVIDVPGATGYLDTNYSGKAEYALESLKDHDITIIHVEAPDEAGHMGDLDAKIKAIEDFDRLVVGRILDEARKAEDDYTILVLPDHPTPISIRTHTPEPVPFAIYSTKDDDPDDCKAFDEQSAKQGSLGTLDAKDLIQKLIDMN